LIIVPGVDFALVTRVAVGFGRRTALVTAGGLLIGGLLHAGFAAVGLSALLLTSAEAYMVVKYAGAAYLAWIGVQAVRSSLRHAGGAAGRDRPTAPHGRASRGMPGTMGSRRAFTMGMISDLLNVKVALFFVTFLPQFVVPGPGAAWQTAQLGLLFNVIASTWWVVYILLIGQLRGWFDRSAVRRLVEAATGAVLIGFGLRLALDR
jgi:threonine/homoserine/homoserine lactone efflux protein